MPPLRERLVRAAFESRSLSRNLAQRGSAALQQRGPVHRLLKELYQSSRRQPVTVNQWDAEYSDGDYTERLDTITHVAHHAVILGVSQLRSKEAEGPRYRLRSRPTLAASGWPRLCRVRRRGLVDGGY